MHVSVTFLQGRQVHHERHEEREADRTTGLGDLRALRGSIDRATNRPRSQSSKRRCQSKRYAQAESPPSQKIHRTWGHGNVARPVHGTTAITRPRRDFLLSKRPTSRLGCIAWFVGICSGARVTFSRRTMQSGAVQFVSKSKISESPLVKLQMQQFPRQNNATATIPSDTVGRSQLQPRP